MECLGLVCCDHLTLGLQVVAGAAAVAASAVKWHGEVAVDPVKGCSIPNTPWDLIHWLLKPPQLIGCASTISRVVQCCIGIASWMLKVLNGLNRRVFLTTVIVQSQGRKLPIWANFSELSRVAMPPTISYAGCTLPSTIKK